MRDIDLLTQFRQAIAGATTGLDDEALNRIPQGFNNHIRWNIGHLVVTQQLLCYQLAGLEMAVDADLVTNFRKGSSPKDWTGDMPSYGELVELFHALPKQMRQDFDAGRFNDYQEYTTSTGIVLSSIEDAVRFNNIHEGIHLGYILALKRAA